MTDPTVITSEEAETLRRAMSKPDLQSGEYGEARDKRLYQPLLRRGLLAREERRHPTEVDYDIVHYETTPLGVYVLHLHDKRARVDVDGGGGT